MSDEAEIMNLFDGEPADPKQAMLWNMQQESDLETKTERAAEERDDNSADLYERCRQAHVNRLRQLNAKHPDLVTKAEDEFESSPAVVSKILEKVS